MGNQKQLSSRIRRKRFANFESTFYSTQLQRWEIQILRNFTLSFLKKVFFENQSNLDNYQDFSSLI